MIAKNENGKRVDMMHQSAVSARRRCKHEIQPCAQQLVGSQVCSGHMAAQITSDDAELEFARIWRPIPKVMFSRTLNSTLLARSLDLCLIRVPDLQLTRGLPALLAHPLS